MNNDMMWDMIGATKFIQALETQIWPQGYHCGLTGGVLYKGYSAKDLDVIIYPHTKGQGLNKKDLFSFITKWSQAEVANSCESISQIRDGKDVRWLEISGKRIDLFFLE